MSPLMGRGASISPSSPTQWEGTGCCLSLKGGHNCPSYPTWVLFFFCPCLWVRHTSPLVGLVFFCPRLWVRHTSPLVGLVFFCPRLWDYNPWSKRKILSNIKIEISPKPERPHPPKLVRMHYTSTPTCTNFLSQF